MKKFVLLLTASLLAFGVGCCGLRSCNQGAYSFEGDDPGECEDRADNNRDGLFDCNDPGCAGSSVCMTPPATGDAVGQKKAGMDAAPKVAAVTGTGAAVQPTSGKNTVKVPPGKGWLHTRGNKIVYENGDVFRGRGANVHDTRSCGACWSPNVNGVKRRIDEVVDIWGANFLRLCLESHEAKSNAVNDAKYMQNIIEIVEHIGKKTGVYVLVSLWWDTTVDTHPLRIPHPAVTPIWEHLTEKLAKYPYVMFGLVNEPRGKHSTDDVEIDANDVEVWESMNNTVAAIRAVEARVGSPRHIIAVQGTRAYGKFLQYYVNHPITADGGKNIAYEVHVYYGNDGDKWEKRWEIPSRKLPVIIGEFAELYESWDTLSLQDCDKLSMEAEKLDVPWLAWTFHTNCGNPLITASNNCETNVTITPSKGWGQLIYNRLHKPWGSRESALP